jgi:translation elongation factor EF-Tu-like GTPase
MFRLFVVEDVFDIKQRGLIIVGRLDDPKNARFRVGEVVEIRRKGRETVETVISGITIGGAPTGLGEVLLRAITKADVGPGDEVWLH